MNNFNRSLLFGIFVGISTLILDMSCSVFPLDGSAVLFHGVFMFVACFLLGIWIFPKFAEEREFHEEKKKE